MKLNLHFAFHQHHRPHQDLFELAVIGRNADVRMYTYRSLGVWVYCYYYYEEQPTIREPQSCVYSYDLSICVSPQFICRWMFNRSTRQFIQPATPEAKMSRAHPHSLLPDVIKPALTAHFTGLYCNVHCASVHSGPHPSDHCGLGKHIIISNTTC